MTGHQELLAEITIVSLVAVCDIHMFVFVPDFTGYTRISSVCVCQLVFEPPFIQMELHA